MSIAEIRKEQLLHGIDIICNPFELDPACFETPDKFEAALNLCYACAGWKEALSNAVYHKAYDEREPIEVRVEKNMIEIISHPGPDRSVTLEGLRTFKVKSRRYRNRRIGDFLKELHLTEGRNTGFQKILDALQKNESPLPEFETDENHDYFITRLFVREGFYDYQDANGTLDGTQDDTLKDSVSQKEQIKKLVREDSKITRKQMAEKLGVSQRTIQRILNDIPEVRFTGGGRNGHWEITGEVDG